MQAVLEVTKQYLPALKNIGHVAPKQKKLYCSQFVALIIEITKELLDFNLYILSILVN